MCCSNAPPAGGRAQRSQRSQRSARQVLVNLALVFLSARIGCGNAQEWAEGYPKLQFGSLGLSAPLPFPAPAGSGIPTGESPMDVLIRFKAKDATSAASFTRGMVSIQLQLSGFMGGDNSWSKTSPGLSAAFIDSAGVLSSASIRLNVTGDAVAWTATTSTLTVNMEKLIATEIIDSEIAIVLAASSFIGGKGPIAPRCVARDTPLYVKKFLSAKTEVAELHTGFVSVAPIGCFGDVKVPFGVTASSWEMKKIGQSSTRNGVGMEETISVTLASRLDIFSVTTSVKSELVISGLLGTQTSDSNVLPIDVQQVTDHFSALDLFQSPPSTGLANTLNTGNWKQETGTLTLTIKDGRMLPLGVPFVFSFKLKLPAVSSESPQVSITAKTGTTVVIPSQLMDSASGDYAPLTTRARTFTVAKIGQLVSGGGQENTISVTLMSNFDIQSTTSYVSKITIAGLKGSASPDSSPQYPYPVVSASKDSVVGIFSDGSSTNMVSWIKSKGELILYIVNGRVLQAGTEYVFSVKLLNEVTPQSSPNMYIQASGETDTGRVEMQRGEGNEAPMFISEPTMSIAKIAQSTSSVGAQNILTISLQSTVGIQAVTGGQISGPITIIGLVGFKDATGQKQVTNQGYNSVENLFVGNSANWDKASGKLVFEIATGKQLAASRLYVFSVTLTNPDFAQASPEISLELAGTRSAAAKLFAMEKASGLKAPLQIDAPTFKELRIGQKYSGAGILNELTVTFTPNLLLGEGYRFNIEGLTGSRTPDTAALPVAGCADIFSSGRWSGSSGTIELYAAKTIPDSTKVVCSFNLLNPTVPQSAATVSITVNVGSGQVSKVIGPKIFRNAPKLNAPFIVPPATFIKANIGQSAPYPGDVNNRITVSLQSNFNIGSAGGIVSSITISGLMGSMTTDSRVLPLVGDVFTRDVASTAAWTKDSGTLVITIGNSQTMSANTLYTFSFVLSNPSQEQSSPEVSISLDRGQAISSMPMTSDTKGCIHSKGDTAPLFIYPMGFLTKKIGIRASWPQASNVVSITLQSSMPMSSLTTSQTSIVVSGLSFDTKFDPAIPITSSAPELFGTSVEWNAAAQDGQLVIKLLGGKTLTAGTQYQIDVVLKNGVVETTWRPQISVKGPATIAATNMEYGGNDWPVQVSFSSPLPTIDVGMTFALTTIQKISKGDTIIVTLPGFTGTGTSSGKHLWGVTSDPPAFMIESTEIDYMDAIAGGSNVALAKYRVGTSSRTHVASSDLYGETGSTIVLDSVDAQVFGKSNVYAGMQMSIAGSNSYHSIYEQTASAPELPAVAHFYPKYQYTEASAVPAGATYAIHSQLEFTSKEDICAGTKVSITVPKGSGIVTPDSGIKKGILVELSHVKTGLATASIGTPDSIASSADQYSGENGKMVEATQVLSTGQDYIGLPWAPTRISTTNFVFVDGFRGIQKYDAGKVWIFPGYGPIRQTTLHAIASGNAMQGTKLELSKNIPANSNDVWLTLSSVADFKPALAKGSFLQLKDEVLRFTGDKALSVVSVESPGQPGEGCQLDTQMCGAGNTNCATITFAGCSDNPSVSVVFSAGAISRFTVKYGGACTNQQIQQLKTPALKATLTLAAGVTCTTTPSCDTGCSVTTSEAENVIKVQRSQFSTSAASLTSCAATTCTDWVKPSTIYLANGGLNSLLYTSSTKELDQSNKQSVKIGYSETVDTVVAGDHVVSVTLPQMPGSNCRKVQGGVSPQPCNRGDVVCATISFSGCSVNPAASLTFENGLITAVPLSESADAGRYGQSICQPHETPVGMIVLENDVECDVDPSCGNGCTLALDSTKDTLVVKHRSMAEDVPHIGAQSVVRVHAAEDIDFKIVLVPPTLCTVEYAETTFLPGQCAPAPKANSVVSWMDPATGGILASMYATADGLSALCLDLGSGALPDFPPACKISCDNKTADGNLVASKPVNITLKYEGNSTGIQVVLMMPITLNTAYVSATRRVAPANFEYRLNGDCECPSSVDSVVNCTIAESGVYQASLVKQDKCKVDNGNESIILAAVLGAVSGILLLLLGCYACDRAYRRSKEEEPKAKEVEEGYEGPVFVGRPVPLTPTLQPYGMLQTLPSPRSPVPINLSIVPTYPYATIHGASPVMAHDAPMWNNSNSFQLGGLPATLTPLPLTRQPARSPVLNMSASMPQNRVSLSPRREREEMGYMTSPRQGSMSPEARASPRSARMPYGV